MEFSRDEKDQIKALLQHRALEYATRKLGNGNMGNSSYSDVFNVTGDRVIQYVLENGFPPESAFSGTASPSREGINLKRSETGWILYWQERGENYDIAEVHEKDEAIRRLTLLILNSSGTGIQFQVS